MCTLCGFCLSTHVQDREQQQDMTRGKENDTLQYLERSCTIYCIIILSEPITIYCSASQRAAASSDGSHTCMRLNPQYIISSSWFLPVPVRLGGWAFETVFLTDTRIPQNLPLGKYVGTVAYGTVFVDDIYFISPNCNLSVAHCPLCTCPKNKSHAINDDVRHVGGSGGRIHVME